MQVWSQQQIWIFHKNPSITDALSYSCIGLYKFSVSGFSNDKYKSVKIREMPLVTIKAWHLYMVSSDRTKSLLPFPKQLQLNNNCLRNKSPEWHICQSGFGLIADEESSAGIRWGDWRRALLHFSLLHFYVHKQEKISWVGDDHGFLQLQLRPLIDLLPFLAHHYSEITLKVS